MRTLALRALAVIALLAPHAALGQNVFGEDDEIVIAILDSGIRPTHVEFAPGQVVAWWDFTSTIAAHAGPALGELWDPVVTAPYDDHGHGTAIASLAAGGNNDPSDAKARSHCPGCSLAIGKVVTARGDATVDSIRDAIRWAVDSAGADVVSLSLSVSLAGGPLPGTLSELDEAVTYARERGVLVAVSAGNGLFDLFPGQFSWSEQMGASTAALVVGGATSQGSAISGAFFGHDPEVVAVASNVRAASHAADDAYSTRSGVSLSTALIAGLGARALAAAAPSGCADAAFVESVIKARARDTPAPYTFEGHGYVGPTEAIQVVADASTCTAPADELDLAVLYEELVADQARWAMSDGADHETATAFVLGGVPPATPPGVLSSGTYAGATEVELWQLDATVGDAFVARLGGEPGPAGEADLYLFAPGSASDGRLLGSEIVAFSRAFGGFDDSFAYRAAHTGAHLLVVVASSGLEEAPYTLAIDPLDGAPAIRFLDQELAVTLHGIL